MSISAYNKDAGVLFTNCSESSDQFNSDDEPSGPVERMEPMGITLNGLRVFVIPKAPTQFEWFVNLWYSPPALLCWSIIILFLGIVIKLWKYPWVTLCIAIFWRLMYNLGLGYLLNKQSRESFLTQYIKVVRENPFSSQNQWLSWCLTKATPNGVDIINDHMLPSAYPAWVLFRSIVNIVEFNDVLAFTVMAVQYGIMERDSVSGLKIFWVFVDIIGSLLIGFSVYGKIAALRTAGDYAWYWGDFFFLKTGNNKLQYDGVFELFPHPMYTIGYGWTYGCAILARSFTVLACVLGFHFSQLLFLTFVESPHVELLYGADYDEKPSNRILAMLPPIPKIDLFNGFDINLCFTLVFFVLGIWFGSFPGGPLDDDSFFLANCVFWRALQFGFEATVLVQQEHSRFWTKIFLAKGMSRIDAFEAWKRIVNLFSSLQKVSFVLAAIRLFWYPKTVSEIISAPYISQILLSFLLWIVSVWSNFSCYEVLGSYGWFYGDFFLSPPHFQASTKVAKKPPVMTTTKHDSDSSPEAHEEPTVPLNSKLQSAGKSISFENIQPAYDGIYRYFNNPEAYLGHLWMYGLALLCSSWDLFFVATLSHAIKIVFLQAVEKPHMRALYKHHVRQHSSAVERAFKGKVSDLKRNETALFLANWVKHPIETGALAPSSRQLATAMCDTMHFGDGCVVLELGPGTGPFTVEIINRLESTKNSHFIGFELNEQFVEKLKHRFPEYADCFIQESAERIIPVLHARGISHADTIISGLPWAIFPDSLQRAILTEVFDALKPGGRFCTFAYLQGLVLPAGQNFKALLDNIFDSVERSQVVWKNFPPAFVYRCQKN